MVVPACNLRHRLALECGDFRRHRLRIKHHLDTRVCRVVLVVRAVTQLTVLRKAGRQQRPVADPHRKLRPTRHLGATGDGGTLDRHQQHILLPLLHLFHLPLATLPVRVAPARIRLALIGDEDSVMAPARGRHHLDTFERRELGRHVPRQLVPQTQLTLLVPPPHVARAIRIHRHRVTRRRSRRDERNLLAFQLFQFVRHRETGVLEPRLFGPADGMVVGRTALPDDEALYIRER